MGLITIRHRLLRLATRLSGSLGVGTVAGLGPPRVRGAGVDARRHAPWPTPATISWDGQLSSMFFSAVVEVLLAG